MKIEFEEWADWVEPYQGVALRGTVDGRRVELLFAGEVIVEFLDAPNKGHLIEKAFMRNKQFMEEIACSVIEAGMLRKDGTVILERKELAPYFEKRAATAPA